MIQVAAAIIKTNDEKILICKRGGSGSCAYLWEFPGGKLEAGETFEQCLLRECREELEIDIKVISVFAETSYTYPERELSFVFFNAEIVNGTPKINVHDDMKWVTPDQLKSFAFCPADVEIIERLVKM